MADEGGTPAPVAVIVAAYRASGTIDQALASVAAQTVRPSEVVVVDDASDDDTVDRACRWSGQLPLAVLRGAVNEGPSSARHRGIDASVSPLVALLDADDVWLPDHLESLLAVHRAHGGVALAEMVRWVPGAGLGARSSALAPLPAPDDQPTALALSNFASIATLFSRQLYDEVGGFRRGLRMGEEWDLYIRMVRRGARLHRADHPTMLHRIRPGSLTWRDDGMADRVRVLELALSEAADDAERAAARRGLRRLAAEQALVEAYTLAGRGRSAAARRRALGAWSGHRRVLLRAAAMVVAPRQVAARRQGVRSDQRRRLSG